MNTQTRSLRLLAGEAMLLPRRAAQAVLTQGEVLVQPPARWLGGEVVLPKPVRLSAPALLPTEPSASVQAIGAAVVFVHEAPSLLSVLSSWAARVRSLRFARAIYGSDKPA
jgi:hypothetical protein